MFDPADKLDARYARVQAEWREAYEAEWGAPHLTYWGTLVVGVNETAIPRVVLGGGAYVVPRWVHDFVNEQMSPARYTIAGLLNLIAQVGPVAARGAVALCGGRALYAVPGAW